jgi:hypothetical protein
MVDSVANVSSAEWTVARDPGGRARQRETDAAAMDLAAMISNDLPGRSLLRRRYRFSLFSFRVGDRRDEVALLE